MHINTYTTDITQLYGIKPSNSIKFKITHSCWLADLKCIDVAETILDVAVNDELCEAQNLTTQMKRVAET